MSRFSTEWRNKSITDAELKAIDVTASKLKRNTAMTIKHDLEIDGNFNDTSDVALKTNIHDMSSGLEMNLRVLTHAIL